MRTPFRTTATFLLLPLTAAACTGGDEGEGDVSPAPSAPVHALATVPPSEVEGLSVATYASGGNPPTEVFVNYPQIEGADALNERIVDEATARAQAFAAAHSAPSPVPGTGATVTPGAASGPAAAVPPVPELNLGYTVLAASDEVYGVRLDVFTSDGTDGGTSGTTFWYDGRTGRVVSAHELFDGPAGRAAVAGATRRQLGRTDGFDAGRVAPVLDGSAPGLASVAFTTTGDLIVRYDAGVLAAPSAGPLDVRVPSAGADAVLNGAGRRARARSAASASPASPSPSPSPSPTESSVRASPSPSSTGGSASPSASASPSGSPSAALKVDCRTDRCVALTFDDGPSAVTPRLLDALRRHGVRATFFLTGTNVPVYAATARRIAGEGHQIGNHTFGHRDLTRLPNADVAAQIRASREVVEEITGVGPTLLRPPYGAVGTVVRGSAGGPLVMWDVDSEDWKTQDSAVVRRAALNGVRAGSIILLHDLYASTVDAVPGIVEDLRRRGFVLATVSELFAGRDLVSGESYTSSR